MTQWSGYMRVPVKYSAPLVTDRGLNFVIQGIIREHKLKYGYLGLERQGSKVRQVRHQRRSPRGKSWLLKIETTHEPREASAEAEGGSRIIPNQTSMHGNTDRQKDRVKPYRLKRKRNSTEGGRDKVLDFCLIFTKPPPDPTFNLFERPDLPLAIDL
ncbi:hypothetical protein K438DRAFT_1784605 [Mycena galopus ATCC 62051]|nr:hypothetical protein K438DRAFT_1784605 [Mycena galopus ATCC 62051]